jgi:hypothetical protein
MPECLIESHRVAFTEGQPGSGTWRRTCADHELRLGKYGEGFCVHLVLAIERHLRCMGGLPAHADGFSPA